MAQLESPRVEVWTPGVCGTILTVYLELGQISQVKDIVPTSLLSRQTHLGDSQVTHISD